MDASRHQTGGGTLSNLKSKVSTKKEENVALIYVGPTIKSLAQYSVFNNGIPPYIESKFERCPELRSLFLPVNEFPSRQGDLNRVGSELNVSYNAVLLTKGV